VLVRSWNLFHGNAVPPRRRAYLEQMIELATVDDPDVVCVQEVPAWALPQFPVADVAARPCCGPLPITAAAGRALTDLHHGVLRSAFSGQGNAMWLARRLRLLAHRAEVLNPRSFRNEVARALRLSRRVRLAWAKERRVVQAVRLATGERTYTVANLHCTSFAYDPRLADAELMRAAEFAVAVAEGGDVVVVAGDFNVRVGTSNTLRTLAGEEWGFSAPGDGIDHVLVRGASVSELRVWPLERRVHDGLLLSDHAPVEVEIA
jgi:endonuclease/exonuclease/phosphatase family metal-dependent hydrolase